MNIETDTGETILVTGGAGYIGSHAVKRLVDDGRDVVVLDNLSRGHREAVDRIADSCARKAGQCELLEADISEREAIVSLLHERGIRELMHFAALAVVGESVEMPQLYYNNNTAGSVALIDACLEAGVERFIFSSTAATYGIPPKSEVPIKETCPQEPINPYGRSKLAVEWALRDAVHAAKLRGVPFSAACLRYFNVAGSDRSGVIGEDHSPETHLIPVVLQHLLGQRDRITVFGTDYDTPDGTCIRDYIHVEDLIDAHVAALGALRDGECRAYNLGIGRGYSVREIIEATERVTGKSCNVVEGDRRAGDPPVLYTDPSLIRSELGWSPSLASLDDIISSAWAWFSSYPNGYATIHGRVK